MKIGYVQIEMAICFRVAALGRHGEHLASEKMHTQRFEDLAPPDAQIKEDNEGE